MTEPQSQGGGLLSLLARARGVLPWIALIAGVVWFSRNVRPSAPFAAGQSLPSIEASLVDGSHFTLEGAPGEVVVLNFWASYCAPCREEAPLLTALHEGGVRVVGLSVEAFEPARVQAIATSLGMRYPVGLSNNVLAQKLSLRSVPTTYVIAADGSIVLSRVGGISERELEDAVAAARKRS
jgi:cytochrome c biogenesis protein CcmG/thiol:disulfide interchange protein DsbE